MPYRALLWTMVTLGIALVALAMWLRAVEPLLAGTAGLTQTAVSHGSIVMEPPPETTLRRLVQAMLLLSFILICLLLMVGLVATLREWIRYRSDPLRKKRSGTAYVDAWKIAGQRLKEKDEGPAE